MFLHVIGNSFSQKKTNRCHSKKNWLSWRFISIKVFLRAISLPSLFCQICSYISLFNLYPFFFHSLSSFHSPLFLSFSFSHQSRFSTVDASDVNLGDFIEWSGKKMQLVGRENKTTGRRAYAVVVVIFIFFFVFFSIFSFFVLPKREEKSQNFSISFYVFFPFGFSLSLFFLFFFLIVCYFFYSFFSYFFLFFLLILCFIFFLIGRTSRSCFWKKTPRKMET